jgi:hypothetical protein
MDSYHSPVYVFTSSVFNKYMLYLEQRQNARISQNWVVVMLIWLVERSFGLISTDLWGGQSDLHFKVVFIGPFLSFDWSIIVGWSDWFAT